MNIKDRRVVVTGAASGIGRALARRFHQEGAKLVVCADLNGDGIVDGGDVGLLIAAWGPCLP